MSRESAEWLNTQTLIGFTLKRGNAWHYSEALQGSEPNHYPGPIPVDDVRRRLFAWEAESRPLYVRIPGRDDVQGFVDVPDRQAIVRSDTGEVLGIFKSGYQPHQYGQWLVSNVANLIGDGDLGIGSAGLLKSGALAWVSIEVPDNVKTPEGVTFRPNLVAATSFDGSLATTYKRTVTNVVCDNTLSAGLGESGQVYRLKHTRYSGLRISDARDALAIVHETGDAFAAEVARLCAIDVPRVAFTRHLDVMIPLTDAAGAPIKGRSLTVAEHKREAIMRLYTRDDRVAPWNGTAFGVLQAYNTYGQHEGTVRGASRVQRNRENALRGIIEATDAEVLRELEGILAVSA